MKLIDVLHLALLNLWRRRLRATLTIVGVVIGTSCIILMLSLSFSSYNQYKSDFYEGVSFTEIQVYKNSNNSKTSIAKKLNDSAVTAIRQLEHVKGASPVIQLSCTIEVDRKKVSLQVLGVDFEEYSKRFSYTSGGMFSQIANMPELVLSPDTLNLFTDNEGVTSESVGDSETASTINAGTTSAETLSEAQGIMNKDTVLTLGYEDTGNEDTEEQYTSTLYRSKVVGVLADEANAMAYMNIDMAKEIINQNRELAAELNISGDNYNQIVVWVDNTENVELVIETLTDMGYTATSPIQYLDEISSEFMKQQMQLFVIALISLLVSAIGIANTMLTSVWERKSEIGIFKVIGMGTGKIKTMFLAEAGFLGFLGGILGTIVSFIGVLIINNNGELFNLTNISEELIYQISIPFWLPLIAISISTIIGIISGVYPAWRATKMSAMEAIRNV